MAKTICIDFDGTIVEHAFPKIGKALENAFEVMNELKSAGFNLILWTCREDYEDDLYLTDAVNFCRKNGVEFHAVNESFNDFRPEDSLRRKPYADYYIDDRNLGGFPGWDWVRETLLTNT